MTPSRPQPASRGAVLDVLRTEGSASRAQISEITGLTQATVSIVVRALLEEGLVEETGEREHTGGKPRVMLALNASALCALGAQLGADASVVVLVDATGALLARTRLPGARGRNPNDVLLTLARAFEEVRITAGISASSIAGVGFATPGLLNVSEGVILRSRSLPLWAGLPLRSELARLTGHPTVLANDATAAALGESWGGRSLASIAHCTVYLGSGIGTGIVLDGSVMRGTSSNTGAIGQMPLAPTDKSEPVLLEDVVVPRAVAARARAAIRDGAETSIELSVGADWFHDYNAIATAAVAGDHLALRLINEAAEHLATAILTLANILDLDSVALAGPAFAIAGTVYLRVAQERLERDFFAADRHPIRVRLAEQVVDAAAVGAASLVLQRNLVPR